MKKTPAPKTQKAKPAALKKVRNVAKAEEDTAPPRKFMNKKEIWEAIEHHLGREPSSRVMQEAEIRVVLMKGLANSSVGSRCSLREAHDIVECQITALKAGAQAVAPNCDACAPPDAPVVDLNRATAPFDTYMDKPGR